MYLLWFLTMLQFTSVSNQNIFEVIQLDESAFISSGATVGAFLLKASERYVCNEKMTNSYLCAKPFFSGASKYVQAHETVFELNWRSFGSWFAEKIVWRLPKNPGRSDKVFDYDSGMKYSECNEADCIWWRTEKSDVGELQPSKANASNELHPFRFHHKW